MQRPETAIGRADRVQQKSETPQSVVEKSAPARSPSGLVRRDSAENQIQIANAAAEKLFKQSRQTMRATGSPNTVHPNEAARALIRGHLETDLSRYFSYPPIARQRGWQGHVHVAFTVQADGQLTDARVTQSSGYHVLDVSALEALRRVGRLPQAREWLQGETLTMELPVIYRLEN